MPGDQLQADRHAIRRRSDRHRDRRPPAGVDPAGENRVPARTDRRGRRSRADIPAPPARAARRWQVSRSRRRARTRSSTSLRNRLTASICCIRSAARASSPRRAGLRIGRGHLVEEVAVLLRQHRQTGIRKTPPSRCRRRNVERQRRLHDAMAVGGELRDRIAKAGADDRIDRRIADGFDAEDASAACGGLG